MSGRNPNTNTNAAAAGVRGRGRAGRGRGGRSNSRGGGRGGRSNGGDRDRGGSGTPAAESSYNGNGNNRNNRVSSSSNGRGNPVGGRGGPAASNQMKRNGEKGAEAHTVPESTRIRFTKILSDMRENPNLDTLEMPTDLTNTERKFLHTLAMQLGLKSKSVGKGDARKIVIRKLSNSKKIAGVDGDDVDEDGVLRDDSLPVLDVGKRGMDSLRRYLDKFPPNVVELAEAEETGSSLTAVGMEDASKDQKLKDALRELDMAASSKTMHHKEKKRKYVDLEKRASLHQAAQQAKLQSNNYSQMQQMRARLPAYTHQQEISDIIANNRVTILSGDTGCGKTTQVPQFVLDSSPTCNIVCTQPRRISAISIAERVASERCERVGQVVGYNVRLDAATSPSTQLVFVTPGILLRKFQSSPTLEEYTHIIIDEIHERDKYTEFLMIALRELMERRTDLRVVLMSATIQTNELRQYWNGVGSGSTRLGLGGGERKDDIDIRMELGDFMPAEICVPGRTFPVQSFYLEDVLQMTGFVNDADFSGGLGDLEADLSALLAKDERNNQKAHPNQRRKKGGNGNGNGNGNGDTSNGSRGSHSDNVFIVSEHSFVCVMCNQGGFKNAEELGTHIGLCNGVGNIDMVALERKVRQTNVSTNFGGGHETVVEELDGESSEVVFEDEYDVAEEESSSDDDDERLGIHDGKWDGESPFGVAEVVDSAVKTTLTEEEMLNRYQMMHDDEQIDIDLIMETIRYIVKASYLDGAILIFLPGWQEISELTLLLESTHPFNDKNKYSVLPLHSGIPSKEQRLVFQRPRQGVRKIVLSTNIAETSVTIDDVAFVIDSGRAKEKNYDPHLKTSTLQPMWISQASAKQRRGRAGRTKAGVCFHLFSRRRHASFREFLESELLRTSLEEICLQCKKLNLTPGGPEDDDGIPAFLAAALTPPHPKSITNAIEKLVELGAMDEDNNDLTRLGNCLSCLSVSPEVGKMIIWSYVLGCSKSVSSMAVAMSYKSPFIIPPPHMRRNADEARARISDGTESDQVTVLKVLQARDSFYKTQRQNQFFTYCRANFVNVATIQMISELRKNIARELSSIGYPDPAAVNTWHSRNEAGSNLPFLQSAIVAGVYPNVASRQEGAVNFSTSTNIKTKLHVGSVNSCKGQPLAKKGSTLEFVAYGEMVKGKAMYTCNQTTYIHSIIPVILLCGQFCIRGANVEGAAPKSVISVDEWIAFQCDKSLGIGLAVLRKRLDSIFHHIVADPKTGFDGLSAMERETLNALDSIMKSSFQSTPPRR